MEIYEELVEGRQVAGLEAIPTAAIIAHIEQHFGRLSRDGGGLVFWEGGSRGVFEFYSSDKHVHFCCRQLVDEDMNAIIDIVAEFESPLFDPQINQRYGDPSESSKTFSQHV
jgi:hypothetical protein